MSLLTITVFTSIGLGKSVGQGTAPWVLDQVTTNTGNGSPITVPSLTPSSSNEEAFLFVNSDFRMQSSSGPASPPPCGQGSFESYLTSVSPPWISVPGEFGSNSYSHTVAATGILPLGWLDSNGKPFYYNLAPFTLWNPNPRPLGVALTANWPTCLPETDWGAVLALVRYTGDTSLGGPVVKGTFSANLSGSQTVGGMPTSTTSPTFLIGYIKWQWQSTDGLATSPTISDSAGNNYITIADVQTSSGCTPDPQWPGDGSSNNCALSGTRMRIFICPNYSNPGGTLTTSGGANTYYIGAVALGDGVSTPSMVDPVPDLLSGSSLTNDPVLLATGGRAVQGVAADGVAEVLLRVPTRQAGEQVTLTLNNDQGTPSNSSDDDGGLGQITGSSFTQNQITVTSEDAGEAGAAAFAVYQAPVDFVRQSYQSADSSLAKRMVTVNVNNSTEGTTATLPIQIIRPPVVLIHGWNDSMHAWDNFTPLVGNSLFTLGYVDYSAVIGNSIAFTVPPLPNAYQQHVIASQMGLEYNTPTVQLQLNGWMQYVKAGNNAASIPVAAVQADLVGHSMGGLVAKNLTVQSEYRATSNFNRGIIHKLITIDTPHLGSQVARNVLGDGPIADEKECVWNFLVENKTINLKSVAFIGGITLPGGAGDLEGDDFSGNLNPTLTTLNQTLVGPIPFAPIGGAYTDFAGFEARFPAHLVRDVLCSHDSLAQHFTAVGWQQLFHNQSSDAIVSLNSQMYGLSDNDTYVEPDVVHSVGAENLGFSGPGVLDPGPVPMRVIDLLNHSWKNQTYFYSLGQ